MKRRIVDEDSTDYSDSDTISSASARGRPVKQKPGVAPPQRTGYLETLRNANGCNATVILAALSFVLLTTAMVIFFLGSPSQPEVHEHKRRRMSGHRHQDISSGGDSGRLPVGEEYGGGATTTVRPDEEVLYDRTEPRGWRFRKVPATTLVPETSTVARPTTSTTRTVETTTTTTTTTTTKTPTTSTTIPTAARTSVLPMRSIIPTPLLCTVGRYARADTRYPEDGLCDFLFCPVALQANLQFSSFSDAFQGFRDQAAAAGKTKYGIDIKISEMDTTLARLQTEQGVAAFKKLWESNIRQHGVLYPVIFDGVNSSYVDMIIGLLNTLRRLQVKFRTNEAAKPSYIFVGLGVVLRGKMESKNIKNNFTRIIREVKPNAILMRTHYVRKDDGDHNCRITGPAVWQGNFSARQPTFLDALRFLQRVTIPENTAVILSFTEAVRWYRWDSANESNFRLGERCVMDFHTDLVSKGAMCSDISDKGLAGAKKHRTTQQVSLVHSHNSYGLVFDTKDTMRTKMCWTITTFGSNLGWAMFDLEFADTENICNDPAFTKGFALLRWMRHYIGTGFHEPSECEPS
ncbi:uncharacterized protein LOC135399787 [Ornithodoros turicata]|uniref:uncharacterized protein LOC135399787 n=1 Tax=Ornithodoros turicata TaxID=34597 RepID=UPI003138BA9D